MCAYRKSSTKPGGGIFILWSFSGGLIGERDLLEMGT